MNVIRHILIILALATATGLRAQMPGDTLAPCRTATEERARLARYFTATGLSDKVFARMQGKSFPKDCTVKRADLRYLLLLHKNQHGQTVIGEMVCHKSIAADLLHIFRRLYDAAYPIERMVLIDNYGGDDDRSMEANNTSCFNFRRITGSRSRISRHGLGMAVDVNPLYNPYVRGSQVRPAKGRTYAHNRRKGGMVITRGDLCHRLFLERGFTWGGAWRSLKDYQHFEKK